MNARRSKHISLTLVLGSLERACLLIPQGTAKSESFESPCFHTHPPAHPALGKHPFLFPAVRTFWPHEWTLFCNPGLLRGEAWSMGLCFWASRHRSGTWQVLKGRLNKGKHKLTLLLPKGSPPAWCVPPRGPNQPPPSIFYLSILLWKASSPFQLAGCGSGGPSV